MMLCRHALFQAQDMVTAVAFTPDGSRIAAGLFRGQVFFYKTEDLKIETQIVCTKSSAKRKIKYGYKVTGLVFRTISEHRLREGDTDSYELLITTNDSSIRLYQVNDLSLTTKFKGFVNKSKPIRASFSNHGHHIICGSDTTGVFIWKVPKRRHMEKSHEKNKHNRERSYSEGEEREKEEKEQKETDEQIRARFESLYYSKKYEVYKKYEKLICDDNFKHLCTTVAIFAPSSALMEAAAHLNHAPNSTRLLAKDRDGEAGMRPPDDFVQPFDVVIFDAEIDGTIRIIRAKSSI